MKAKKDDNLKIVPQSNTSCTVCGTELTVARGTQNDPLDGYTAYCKNKDCGMADWGHGKDEKGAISVFLQKCGKNITVKPD